ncbi:MAG: hypothetical protein Kow0079_00300 [Vicingaceae bacterium]
MNDLKEEVGNIVVIPCYKEPLIIDTLKSLDENLPTLKKVKVFIVINHSEEASEVVKNFNIETFEKVSKWIKQKKNKQIEYSPIKAFDLPKKDAGVGLARKIGMDKAFSFFENQNTKGIITCFDADAVCSQNYLKAIESHFYKNVNSPACSIHFEHPIEGNDYESEIYTAIINYELHLRYYKHALTYIQYPFNFYTIGSSMAVRSDIYKKIGGMNKRKAGEDFYFLQKIMPLGNFTSLKEATVFPSPRISDRVPFGTGKAVGEIMKDFKEEYFTYHFDCFIAVKQFIAFIPDLYDCDVNDIYQKLPAAIVDFLKSISFNKELIKIKRQSKSQTHFLNRFYYWFTPFRLLKTIHFLRDNYYGNEEIDEASKKLFKAMGYPLADASKKEKLKFLRNIDKR